MQQAEINKKFMQDVYGSESTISTAVDKVEPVTAYTLGFNRCENLFKPALLRTVKRLNEIATRSESTEQYNEVADIVQDVCQLLDQEDIDFEPITRV